MVNRNNFKTCKQKVHDYFRVKRRRSQSPAEALLVHLSAKRPRPSDDKADKSDLSSKTVFQFVTTLTNTDQDENSIKKIVIAKASEKGSNAARGNSDSARRRNIKVNDRAVAIKPLNGHFI